MTRVRGGVVFGRLPRGFGISEFEVPCNKCVGCFQDRALVWKTRVVHESMLYDKNLFVTLKYRDEDLPDRFSLDYSHFQDFMRKLRKAVRGVTALPEADGRRPIRFFMCGEYGGNTGRPHFHAVLFNCWFPDQKKLWNGDYRSDLAEELWGRGFVQIGRLTGGRAAYVAGYVQKKALRRSVDAWDSSTGEVIERRREFQEMSVRPGIGAYWYARFGTDLFPGDVAIVDGKKMKVPRYYFERYRREVGEDGVARIRELRRERSRAVAAVEKGPERRAVKEELAKLRLEHFQRGL